ncbi:MAG: hypothetical protein KIS66_03560 [Fimbriimonadaceae bacterium]|nr:hypothetical protein [Fimbriimonadaceae bacterium]
MSSLLPWLVASIALSGSGATPNKEEHSLLPTLKVGDIFVYEMRAESKAGERASGMNAIVEMHVDGFEDGLIRFKNYQKNTKTKVGVKESSLPDSVYGSKLKPTGEIVWMEVPASSPERTRFGRLMLFQVPTEKVAVGSKWTWATEPSAANGQVGAESRAECLGFEEHGGTRCAKVRVAVRETSGEKPASGTIETWVSLKDGLGTEIRMAFENTPFAPGVAGSFRATYIRVPGA